MKKYILLFFAISLSLFNALAQDVRRNVNHGNRFFEQGKYGNAEEEYRRALGRNINSFEARFNLGNALYRQGRFFDAQQAYSRAAALTQNRKRLAAAYYNSGNALFHTQEYAKSIEAYKQALRKNPQDDDARYNLALTQIILQQQPQQEEQSEMQPETAEQMLDALQQMERQPRRQQHQSQRREVEKEW